MIQKSFKRLKTYNGPTRSISLLTDLNKKDINYNRLKSVLRNTNNNYF